MSVDSLWLHEARYSSTARRAAAALPGSLLEAVELCEQSELVRRILGDHVFFSFIKNKKIEWDEYRGRVTDWELKRYLPIL